MRDVRLLCKRLRLFTWLFLGLCFAVLYSCPIKKFLIIHFDKVNPSGMQTERVEKHLSSTNTRIAWLKKDNFSAYKIPESAVRLVLSNGPSFVDRCRSYFELVHPATPVQTGNAPPLYLRHLRLQV